MSGYFDQNPCSEIVLQKSEAWCKLGNYMDNYIIGDYKVEAVGNNKVKVHLWNHKAIDFVLGHTGQHYTTIILNKDDELWTLIQLGLDEFNTQQYVAHWGG
jgi:hypothetical protein